MALEKPIAPTPPKPPTPPQKQADHGSVENADTQHTGIQNSDFGVHISITNPKENNAASASKQQNQTNTQTVAADGSKPTKGTATKTVSEAKKVIPSAAQEMLEKDEASLQTQAIQTIPETKPASGAYMPMLLVFMLVVGVVLYLLLTKKKSKNDNIIKLSKKQDALKSMGQKIVRVPETNSDKKDDKTHGSFEVRI